MKTAVIRVIFGDILKVPKYKMEVETSLNGNPQREWFRDNAYHFAIGEENYDLLKLNGAKRVELIDPRNWILNREPDFINMYYHKVYLIKVAMSVFNEILFVDFDAGCVKTPDDRMWDLVRAKGGKFNGEFQALNVAYRQHLGLRQKYGGLRVLGVHPLNQGLNTSVLYCNNRKWIEDWEDFYLHTNQSVRDDEHVLLYYLDHKVGIFSLEEMVENFELDIGFLRRGTWPAKATKKKENIYFRHK